MGGTYWRVEYIKPATPGDDRCVLLYGERDEIVGPLTIELAEAWIDYFDNRRAQADKPPIELSQIAAHRNQSLPPA